MEIKDHFWRTDGSFTLSFLTSSPLNQPRFNPLLSCLLLHRPPLPLLRGRRGSLSPPLVCAACCTETRRRASRELSGAELAFLLRFHPRTKSRGGKQGTSHRRDNPPSTLSHGSISGSWLLLNTERISLRWLRPSCWVRNGRVSTLARRSAGFASVCRCVCDSACLCVCVCERACARHHAEVFFGEKGEAR